MARFRFQTYETLRVKSKKSGKELVINKRDFDEKKHSHVRQSVSGNAASGDGEGQSEGEGEAKKGSSKKGS